MDEDNTTGQLLVNVTPELFAYIKQKVIVNDCPDSIKRMKEAKSLSQHSIGVADVKWLHNNASVGDGLVLHRFITSQSIVLPVPYQPPRNPELEKRIQRLKAQQLENEYQKMTENVGGNRRRPSPEDSIGNQLKEINAQMIGVLQFVVSLATAFAFGSYGIPLINSDLSDTKSRVLLGVFCAVVVGFAELYFLVKYISEGDAQPSSKEKVA